MWRSFLTEFFENNQKLWFCKCRSAHIRHTSHIKETNVCIYMYICNLWTVCPCFSINRSMLSIMRKENEKDEFFYTPITYWCTILTTDLKLLLEIVLVYRGTAQENRGSPEGCDWGMGGQRSFLSKGRKSPGMRIRHFCPRIRIRLSRKKKFRIQSRLRIRP